MTCGRVKTTSIAPLAVVGFAIPTVALAVLLRHRPEGAPFEGVELHYFCLRGLGELPRLMLEVTGTAYDSVMYFDTKEYKDIGPFGQMPLLKDPPNLGGHLGTGGWLPQSSTIVRHIARVNGLDAPDDPLRQARIDFIFEGSKDIAGKKAIAHITSDDGSQDFARGHTTCGTRRRCWVRRSGGRAPRG